MMHDNNIGFFRVIDKKTGQIIGRYDYDKITAKERSILRNNEKQYRLYCDCIPNNSIELKISSNLVIYPVQNNTGELHDPACPRFKSADSKDWSYDYDTKTFKASSYNTAEIFIRKLNRLTFQDAMYSDKFASIQGAKVASRKLSTNSGIKLSTVFNPQKIEKGHEYFIYTFLGQLEGIVDNYAKLMCIQEPNADSPYYVYADVKQFDKYFGESKYFVVGENNSPLLVSGWVYLDDDNRLILTDFWVRATGKNGKLFF